MKSLLPRARSRALIPFPFPFIRLPRRLSFSQLTKKKKLGTLFFCSFLYRCFARLHGETQKLARYTFFFFFLRKCWVCSCSVSFSLPLIFTLVAASISPFSHRRYKIFVFFFQRNLDCKTVRTVLRIQVRASSQTKGLERGWKQRARLGRDAKNTFFFSLASHALRDSSDFFTDFEKKTDRFAV